MFLLAKKRTALRSNQHSNINSNLRVTNFQVVSHLNIGHIKVFLVNARSLRNKFTDLETHAFVDDYDIIGITESWLDTKQRDFLAEYSLPGYTIFSSERNGRMGGGVLLYIKTNLNPVLTPKPLIDNIDAIYVQLRNESQQTMTLGLIYRPPAQSNVIDSKLFEQIAEVCCIQNTVISGDFNLPVKR